MIKRRMDLVERCPTGIPGFDKICQGGLVRNNVYVLRGGPGAGKSIFLLQFLWNGIQLGENGLFISFESDVTDIMQDASLMGWDFTEFERNNKVKFMKMAPRISERELTKQILEIVAKYDIKRVCIDPMSIYLLGIDGQLKVRKTLFSLTSLLKRMKVTVIFSTETAGDGVGNLSNSIISGNDVVDFLVDGIINLHSLGIGGDADRAVRIIKMRRTNHVREPVPMEITDNGIVLKF